MDYKIPLFELNFDEREVEAAMETIRSGWISIGPKTTELEQTFSRLLNVKHSVALTNCTVSLHLALQILGITHGDEVICPSLTFVATVNAIRYVGATPVFCDIISPENLTIDPVEIEKNITNKTKAIIVMHFAGFPCEMQKILEIAQKYNLKIVEDACHGPLSEYQGQKLGTLGDIGCFSFFSNKNISTGEGGMLITSNDAFFEKAKLMRSHGMTTLSYERAKGHSTSYDVVELGYNFRIDDIRASIGIVQLQKLEADLIKRAVVRKNYIEKLSHIDKLILPFRDHREFSSNYIFPVVLRDSNVLFRDEIRNKLHSKGIQTSVHYPPVHKFTIYKPFTKSLPITEYVVDNEITLPMHGKMTPDQIDYIAEVLTSILNEQS